MRHSQGHIIEMSWSYVTEWIRAVHMFHYRLCEDLPEDKLFFESKGLRQEVDFNCYLLALRRLERTVIMGYAARPQGQDNTDIKLALETFKRLTPYLANLRNVNEHFDDYLNQKGNTKSVDTSAMAVWIIESNGKQILRQGSIVLESLALIDNKKKGWKISWLDHDVELDQSTEAADHLYLTYLKWFKSLPKPL